MKEKVTLTMEPGVTYNAKRRAKEQGRSLSNWVETLLQDEMSDKPEHFISNTDSSFTGRWKGKADIKAIEDERARHLKSKYIREHS